MCFFSPHAPKCDSFDCETQKNHFSCLKQIIDTNYLYLYIRTLHRLQYNIQKSFQER